MSKTNATTSNKLDSLKWLLVIFLVAASIVSFYYFDEQLLILRVIGLLAVFFIAVLIAKTTEKGQTALDFLQQSHLEIRRVVWPTRQETVQMTGVVLVLVLVVALFIWGLDSILFWIVRFFTGQGG